MRGGGGGGRARGCSCGRAARRRGGERPGGLGRAAARARAEPGPRRQHAGRSPGAGREEARPCRLAGPSCELRERACQCDGSRRGARRRFLAGGQQEPPFSAGQLNPAGGGAPKNRDEIYRFIPRNVASTCERVRAAGCGFYMCFPTNRG